MMKYGIFQLLLHGKIKVLIKNGKEKDVKKQV